MRLALAALITVLVACSPRPVFRPGEDFQSRPERMVFEALAKAKATDEQRLAVMKAWDETQPRLRELNRESAAIIQQWRTMDRREPDFGKQAGELAKHFGEVSQQRMELNAKFDASVGAVLDGTQWGNWQLYWNRSYDPAMGPPPRRQY